MYSILRFELQPYWLRPIPALDATGLLAMGLMIGLDANLPLGPAVQIYSPYAIGLLLGYLSLLSLLFCAVFVISHLFRESDAGIEAIWFATPMTKASYFGCKIFIIFGLSFACYSMLVIGTAFGLFLRQSNPDVSMKLMSLIAPWLIFGAMNTLTCTSLFCCVAWMSRSKLLVYGAGLFLFMAYMLCLVFSSSPLVSRLTPQSEQVVFASALLDPFGLSTFALQTARWSILERNIKVVSLTGVMLWNRVGFLVVSLVLLGACYRGLRLRPYVPAARKPTACGQKVHDESVRIPVAEPQFGLWTDWLSICSFTRVDLTHIAKGIPFLLIVFGVLFNVGMEMYALIERGIRMPQQYASSGLMARSILRSFHDVGLLVILFFGSEIYWRSRLSRFHLVEQATPASHTTWFFSKWFSLGLFMLFLSLLSIGLGLLFQFIYGYNRINAEAYLGVLAFLTFPLLISIGVVLLTQRLVPNRALGLGVAGIAILFTATPILRQFLEHPLWGFQLPYQDVYSDFCGYSGIWQARSRRYIFGFLIVFVICLLTVVRRAPKRQLSVVVCVLLTAASVASISAYQVASGFANNWATNLTDSQVEYERSFRKFQHHSQPSVTHVDTEIDLYPSKRKYTVRGTYMIENKTQSNVESMLLNVSRYVVTNWVKLKIGDQMISIDPKNQIVKFPRRLEPGETAELEFEFAYEWNSFQPLHPFNAIVENGAFMRISRYYPKIGYLANEEVESLIERTKLGLGEMTPKKTIDSPKSPETDFIQMKMTLSTEGSQTAVCVGELTQQWSAGDRNFFRYESTAPIPFQFGVSSAEYEVSRAMTQSGIWIEVLYHPAHHENVEHLIHNAELALEYCESNFGPCPFSTVRFAEISAFTKGFVGTAYPGTIFMTENTLFHANLTSDKTKDVINELAGHELSHLWWGNSQISPDAREGEAILTETLAMYTELMLMKQMYGEEVALERVKLHLRMYLEQRGYSEEQPLYRAESENTHLTYSKGMIVMYQLSRKLGEDELNRILKRFLIKHAFPSPKPITSDLIEEFYVSTPTSFHETIDDLFKRITFYDFQIQTASVEQRERGFHLTLKGSAEKRHEDGKGVKTSIPFNGTIDLQVRMKNQEIVDRSIEISAGKIESDLDFTEEPVEVKVDPSFKYLCFESSIWTRVYPLEPEGKSDLVGRLHADGPIFGKQAP